MKALLFPGQGVQHVGMGADLFARYPKEVATADDILGYSVQVLCLQDPERRLQDTRYAQPAIHIVNCLSFMKWTEAGGQVPAWVAGHSLGEFAALFAAGVFGFADGVRIVKRRAELMAQANGGGMVAVLGLSQRSIEHVLERASLTTIDIANFNTSTQIVISGPREDVVRAVPLLKAAGAADAVVLRVSAAFHSRYMEVPASEFAHFLREFRWARPAVPVVSNVTARPYGDGEVGTLLARQIVSPVRWLESIRFLIAQPGVEPQPVGPGTVVDGMLKAIQREALTPDAAEATAPVPLRSAAAPAIPDDGAQCLGAASFRAAHGVRLAYAAGAMYKGIASVPLVVRMARAGLLSFYGAGGQPLDTVAEALVALRQELGPDAPFGMNLLASPNSPGLERRTVDLYLAHGVRLVEAAAYTQITPALVKYRLAGLAMEAGGLVARHRVLAKVSHPGVAEAFMRPAPQSLVQQLLASGEISADQAAWSQGLPIADDVCAEADSGGHTDGKSPFVLLPSVIFLRDRVSRELRLERRVRVGAAGGIGTPQSAAAAFLMGADFVMTGSINQCTPEAGTSDAVKDLLMGIDVHDTTLCPSGDYFETGARIQVLRKGVFFPARAQRLFELYLQHQRLEDIAPAMRQQLEEKFFGRSIDAVYEEIRQHYGRADPEQIALAERNPRHRMALVFRWYFVRTSRLAREGDLHHKVNFQVHCGPALGAFNQWVRGGRFEHWRSRHVDEIADALMAGAAALLARPLAQADPR